MNVYNSVILFNNYQTQGATISTWIKWVTLINSWVRNGYEKCVAQQSIKKRGLMKACCVRNWKEKWVFKM